MAELPNAKVEIYSKTRINGYSQEQYHIIGEIFFPGRKVGVSSTYELGIETPEGPLLILLRRSYGRPSEDKRHFSIVDRQEVVETIEACLTDTNKAEIEAARHGILEGMTRSHQ